LANIFIPLICGFVFGLGLVISQMANPAKVLNFLDFAGAWDPSLAFVMGGAVATAAIGFRLAWRSKAPLLGDSFHLPQRTRVDARLVGGAALFGIGWGLVGFCPGPALTALSFGGWEAALFVAAMIVGMVLFDRISTLMPLARRSDVSARAR
jgi:uncharacterized membrane protein YedE/YeeE